MSQLSAGAVTAELKVTGVDAFNATLAAARGRIADTGRAADAVGARFKDAFARAGAAATSFVQQVRQVGERAQIAFAAGTAAITGFVAAASPDALNTLTGSFKLLAAEIGRAFVPYVLKASLAIQDASRWFRSLSDDQRDSVAQWSLWAVGAAGALVIGARVVTVFTAMAGAAKLAGAGVLAMGGAFSALAAAAALAGYGIYKFQQQGKEMKEDEARQRGGPEQARSRFELLHSDPYLRLQQVEDPEERRKKAEEQIASARVAEEAAQAGAAKYRTGHGRFFYSGIGGPSLEAELALQRAEQASRQRQLAEAAMQELVGGKQFQGLPGPGGTDALSKLIQASAARPAQTFDLSGARSAIQMQSLNTDPLQRELLEIQRQTRDANVRTAAGVERLADMPVNAP